jgi:hypothetical protein
LLLLWINSAIVRNNFPFPKELPFQLSNIYETKKMVKIINNEEESR